jgi:hypothetical protein
MTGDGQGKRRTAATPTTADSALTVRARDSIDSARALLGAIERGEIQGDVHQVWFLRGVVAGLEALIASGSD